MIGQHQIICLIYFSDCNLPIDNQELLFKDLELQSERINKLVLTPLIKPFFFNDYNLLSSFLMSKDTTSTYVSTILVLNSNSAKVFEFMFNTFSLLDTMDSAIKIDKVFTLSGDGTSYEMVNEITTKGTNLESYARLYQNLNEILMTISNYNTSVTEAQLFSLNGFTELRNNITFDKSILISNDMIQQPKGEFSEFILYDVIDPEIFNTLEIPKDLYKLSEEFILESMALNMNPLLDFKFFKSKIEEELKQLQGDHYMSESIIKEIGLTSKLSELCRSLFNNSKNILSNINGVMKKNNFTKIRAIQHLITAFANYYHVKINKQNPSELPKTVFFSCDGGSDKDLISTGQSIIFNQFLICEETSSNLYGNTLFQINLQNQTSRNVLSVVNSDGSFILTPYLKFTVLAINNESGIKNIILQQINNYSPIHLCLSWRNLFVGDTPKNSNFSKQDSIYHEGLETIYNLDSAQMAKAHQGILRYVNLKTLALAVSHFDVQDYDTVYGMLNSLVNNLVWSENYNVLSKDELTNLITKTRSLYLQIMFLKDNYSYMQDTATQALTFKLDHQIDPDSDTILVYYNLAAAKMKNKEYEEAIFNFSTCKEIRTNLSGIPELEDPFFHKCNLFTANLFSLLGDTEMAVSYYQMIIEFSKKTKKTKKIAETLTLAGKVYYSIKDYQKALDYFNEAITYIENSSHKETELYSNILWNKGYVFFELKKYIEAQSFLEQAIQIQTKLKGEYDSYVIQYEQWLANTYYYLQRYEISQTLYSQIITKIESLDPETKNSKVYLNLGNSYLKMEDYEKALNLYLKANQITLANDPENSSLLATNYNNIGVASMLLNKFKESKEALEKAVLHDAVGGDSINVLLSLNQARLKLMTGFLEESLEDYKAVYQKIKETSLDETKDKDLELALTGFTNYYYQTNNYEKAIDFAKRAEEININFSNSIENIDLVGVKIRMGLIYHKMGKYGEAIEYFNLANDINKKLGYENFYSKGAILIYKGITYLSMCKYANGVKSIHDGLDLISKGFANDAFEVVVLANIALANLYFDCKQFTQAELFARKAYDLSEIIWGSNLHTSKAASQEIYGSVLAFIGKKEQGYKLMNQALESKIAILGKDNIGVVDSYNSLSRYYNYVNNHNSSLLKIMAVLDIISTLSDEENLNERTVQFYKNYADLNMHLKKYDDALHFYQKALDLQTKLSDESSLIHVEIYRLLFELKTIQMDSVESQIYINKAVEYYKKIVSENEQEGKLFVEILNKLIEKLK